MDLSIIIVNYNVKYFLEQCLHSVQQASEGNRMAEVFVVDNNSVDGSVDEIRAKFPWVRLIANRENLGFSRANNQAIRESTGRYVLLLNPDTVVEENTFRKCITFMDPHPDAGAMGVKMIDGKGVFLPESKRSLPTPMVSFYKMFGLASLFPSFKTIREIPPGLPGQAGDPPGGGAGRSFYVPAEGDPGQDRAARRDLLHVWRGHRPLLPDHAGRVPQLLLSGNHHHSLQGGEYQKREASTM